jgi:hypothetical protein
MNGALLPLALSFGLVLLAPRIGSAAKRLMYGGTGGWLAHEGWTHIEMYDQDGALIVREEAPGGAKKFQRFDFAKRFLVEHGRPGRFARLTFGDNQDVWIKRVVRKVDEVSLWERTFVEAIPLLDGRTRPNLGSRARRRPPEEPKIENAYFALNHWHTLELFDEKGKLVASTTYSTRGRKKDDYRHQLSSARRWLRKHGKPGFYLQVVAKRTDMGYIMKGTYQRLPDPEEEYRWTDGWKQHQHVETRPQILGPRLEIEDREDYEKRGDLQRRRDAARARRQHERVRLAMRRVGR